MSVHPIRALIEAADRAITAEDFDTLLEFYTEDAVLVVTPDRLATGKDQIRKACIAIAAHFGNELKVSQGEMRILENGDTALVIMETLLDMPDGKGGTTNETRRATYVFTKVPGGRWRCAIDNSYGTSLLDQVTG